MSASFNHSMLLLARQYRERSQAEVASASGLNQGHYSRIENGLLPDGPSDENAERVATALGFPVSFFFQSDDVVGLPLSVHPMHRKKASLGERALKAIHAELNLRLIHLRKFLTSVDLTTELPLPWIDVDEGGGPQEVARTIRRAWKLPDGPVSNLTDCCERAGILVIWCEFDAPIDGVTMRVRDLPPCVFLNRKSPADRMRFSLAHEVGHLIMHKVPTDGIEAEANQFAGELLVPEKQLLRQIIGHRVTLELLVRQKAYWRTSINFLLYKIAKSGHITRHQSEYLWKQLSGLGWRTREPQETDVPYETPALFPRVLQIHAEELKYSVEDLAKILNANKNDVVKFYQRHIPSQRQRLFLVK